MLSYGHCSLVEGERWRFESNPEALIMLRRILGRDPELAPWVEVERCGSRGLDLAWFLQRYPHEIAPHHKRILDADCDAQRKRLALLPHLQATPPTPPRFPLAIPARPYQREAAGLWLRLGRLLLGDDMGLGKTITAIAGLSDPRTRPAVVVMDTHLPEQWASQIGRFCPSLKTYICKGTRPPPQLPQPLPDVFLLPYSRLAGWAERLSPVVVGVVFDEVQELRSGKGTKKYEGAERLVERAKYVLGMSATPTHNYGGEYYNVLNLILPGVLGSVREFVRTWGLGEAQELSKVQLRDPAGFGYFLKNNGYMIRRTRADVGRELPKIEVIPYPLAHDVDVFNTAAPNLKELAWKAKHAQGKDRAAAAFAFERTIRRATGLAKVPYLAALIRMLIEQGERPVVFLWHREVYTALTTRLAAYKPVHYTGAETSQEKQASLDAFLTGKASTIFLSLRAGRGLDGLQRVSKCVVIGEQDWCFEVHDQCVGRVARDGQAFPVAAFIPIAEIGSDPFVAGIVAAKRTNTAAVLGIDQPLPEVGIDPILSLADKILEGA